MNSYQVIRPFSEHQPGEILTAERFLSAQRVAQLVSQRYITPVQESGVIRKVKPAKESEHE